MPDTLVHIPIVLIDIEGYSRLREAAEQRTVLARLNRVLEESLKPFSGYGDPHTLFGWHGTGDGYYITMQGFSSSVAMRFAVDLEKKLTRENAQYPDFPLRLRIGLCLGDVERVGRQQLSRAYTEANRLVDHSWTRAVLQRRPEGATVLVTSALFMDDWKENGRVHGRTLAIPKLPPWQKVVFSIKHDETVTGYLRVEAALLDAIRAEPSPSLAPAATTVDLIPWLESLLDRTGSLEVRGIGSGAGRQQEAGKYPIEQLYTPLRSQGSLDAGAKRTKTAPPRDGEWMREEKQMVSLAELLPSHRQLLIEGQPGAGKTTFLKLVAAMLAKDLLGIPHPHGSWRQYHLGMQEAARHPLFLRLSELARLLAADPQPAADDRRRLLDLLVVSPNGSADPAWRSHWEGLLRRGEVILLLDGLDEVADEVLRRRVVSIVHDAVRNWSRCPLLVSSRPFGVGQMKGLNFQHVRIEPFGEEEIHTFIDRWSTALYAFAESDRPPQVAANHQQILLQAILHRPAIRLLATNPVMLTCLCVVHWNEGRLPEARARVYQAVMRWLIAARSQERTGAGYTDHFAMKAFAALALTMMQAGKGGTQAVFSTQEGSEAVHVLVQRHLPQGHDRAEQHRLGRVWLAFECLYSGIVEEVGEQRLKFWHLTFQEYLAALALAWLGDGERTGEDYWPLIRDRLEAPQWRETVALLPGTLFDEGGDLRVDRLLERVLALRGQDPTLARDAATAGIVGRLLEPMAAYQYQPSPAFNQRWQAVLTRVLELFTQAGAQQVPIQTRIEVAKALGRGGDPRLQGLNLIEVPDTGGWSLGKYLVTVAEYRAFVEQEGYREQRWWCDAGWRLRAKKGWESPGNWDDQCLHSNRPVVNVSWFEAMAYCRWLSAREQRLIRLPVEKVWAKAAGQGKYPWGDAEPSPERANFDRNVGAPTPVGLYPAGDGLQGHCDLAGNVWEWQRNPYESQEAIETPTDPAVAADDVPVWRGGGSWFGPAGNLRAASRGGGSAEFRLGNLGFRVAAAPSSMIAS
ncbi:MAG: SUMF1/EgtB/PvdO family nonheme iron enzyme [Magnetococcales bacterium]|nr:SUMF1/EgtB/PvdO family nonheme iron enzyme [Magnetococcales bacterium]